MVRKIILLLFIFVSLSYVIMYLIFGNASSNLNKFTYNSNVNYKKNDFTDSHVTIVATGDVMLGRTVNFKTQKNNDFTWAFKNTSTLLKNADITLINLESPLTKNCTPTNEGMRFCGETKHIQGLLEAGIDIASLANNHASDHGENGFRETQEALVSNGILVTGSKNSVTKSINDTTVSFISYNDIPPYPDFVNHVNQNTYEADIKKLHSSSDIVIASFHWGHEYTEKPSNRQIEIARKAIDAGADIVIGHHPHWIQPIEIYKEKPIFYSLGNFIFDQMWSQKTREGLVVKLYYENNQLQNYDLIPIVIDNFGQARTANKEETSKILTNLNI